MARTISALIIGAALFSSCSATKKQFGRVIIDPAADTATSKQDILKIRNTSDNIFDSGSFTGKEKTEIKYRLFKPVEQKSAEKYPLVIVFHGSGSIGTDNRSQLGILPKLLAGAEIQNNYPAYILAPQFPTRSADYTMDNTRKVLVSVPRPCLNSALELIDSLKAVLNIDNERIYAVGFSMGGSTVINSLSARPDLFAAGISIAGIPQFNKLQELSGIPIWLIHGIDDTENPISSDEQLYKEINSNILFWKLKATTHDNIFSKMILGDVLPSWLFKQRKKS